MLIVITDSGDQLKMKMLIFSYKFFNNLYKHKYFSESFAESKRQ